MKFLNQKLSISLPIAAVNIEEKKRSNLFTWRGQFSPQLIEAILLNYADENEIVFDPFLGSGTVLYECALLNIEAYGCDINPAAIAFSKIYELINFDKTLILTEMKKINEFINDLPQKVSNNGLMQSFEEKLLAYYKVASSEIKKNILMALITGLDFGTKKIDIIHINKAWKALSSTIENLPESKKQIRCYQSDSRQTPLEKNSVSFVLTSPPYINVFNYHQNYRKSIEMTGSNVLNIAKSEIGANRKFRQNRFLTVVQYCMDMALVFEELNRVCKQDAKIIFIVGRESQIKGITFKNAELVSNIAKICGFNLTGIQERVFLNKFGKSIYEEILKFTKSNKQKNAIIEQAREVGRNALKEALNNVDEKIFVEIESAYIKSKDITISPFLDK